MALDVVFGEPRHRALALQLTDVIRGVVSNGTVYLGYPVLATADERVHLDALLASIECGIVAFQIADTRPTDPEEWAECIEEQDRLYSVLDSHLGRHDGLRRGRKLALEIETITVFPSAVSPPASVDQGHYCSLDEVAALVQGFAAIDPAIDRALQAALQRVTTIKPTKRRRNVRRSGSKGAVLKEIEKGIANLDMWQKRAAIETPEGPQRIRGLAGSGKTIVLALKAAYLHAQYPEWRIAVAFQSRSLYQQLEDLVVRFTFEHSNDKPDFEQLQLLHAWGAANRAGVYKTIAQHMGVSPRDFNYGLSAYGREEAFAGVCRELLEIASQGSDEAIFDAVLVDEAQDLPAEFFQLVYRFTREPKRIVWAFDELQNLSESAMPSTDELFGTNSDGSSLVTLTDAEGEARRDIILPVCYRNSPWALATAHAVGFGIYREDGLVQHFDDLDLWEQIGYRIQDGQLAHGESVTLARSAVSSPEYFAELIQPADAVTLRSFNTETEQDSWVAEQIALNLEQDELEHDDILVVLPNAYTSKRRASRFSRVLARHGIDSHLAGVGSSVDELFMHDSVAVAHIYRAKGNEAPMVYVMDAQYGAESENEVSRRNTLFTAITRSRAWVRICGWGDRFLTVANEIDVVSDRNFNLTFTIPTVEELASLRRIHRERKDDEAESVRRATRTLGELIEAIDSGEVEIEDLPARLRTRLARLVREDVKDDSDTKGS